MTRFQEYCERQTARYGKDFIAPKGDEFIAAYNEAPRLRVKVQGEWDTRWGYVSLTTGWAPAFILMRRLGQHGSSDLLSPDRDKIIARHYR